jgi:FADH2 O2-dependent halogenase
MVGADWAMLPNTAGFIDPLHSTGIAQTMCGIERLIGVLEQSWERGSLASKLHFYEQTLRDEFDLIDRIVAMGYASRFTFRLFAASAMLYFAAATTYERRRQAGELRAGAGFLCADDPCFREAVQNIQRQLMPLLSGRCSSAEIEAFERFAAAELRPFNHAGLFDPAAQNMYRYTALPA